ncbi:MAG: TM0106 family RecB-like putative nuclease [Planctomycetota bacterium]
MRRITGTHLYSFAKCPRLAALDLTRERAERRPPTPWEEFAARRGRDFEDVYVKGLDAVRPQHPERDFDAGAAATLALLRQGAPLVHQAVLQDGDRLGLPDLLRRVDGPSALGAHHYEVVDVKTSGRARGDQILQVMFYSRLLAAVQQRMPACGAVVLKDGREERFCTADYDAVTVEVEDELRRLRDDPAAARPFRQRGCDTCHWNHRCLPELAEAKDLSLVQGMSHGARAILEAHGCRTVADLATLAFEGGRAPRQLDGALLRRLRKAAQATMLGAPVIEARPTTRTPTQALEDGALVHLLRDPYADRVLAFGVLYPIDEAAAPQVALPGARTDEWDALHGLLTQVPRQAALVHFDGALAHWYEEQAFAREASVGLSSRFVELQRRLRAVALFPAPVFTLADFVRAGLGRDPHRAGHVGAAAMWLGGAGEGGGDGDGADAAQKLVAKVGADLHDLAALMHRVLGARPTPAELALGTDAGTATA